MAVSRASDEQMRRAAGTAHVKLGRGPKHQLGLRLHLLQVADPARAFARLHWRRHAKRGSRHSGGGPIHVFDLVYDCFRKFC